MEFFDNHRKLFTAAFLFFLSLSLFAAIIPAFEMQDNNAPLPGSVPLSADAEKGKLIFIANGCVACHTQQVRNVDMDKTWGNRPSIAADYAGNHRIDLWRNTATLMGTERTGPDLTDIGNRQPAVSWHLVHLYNPRIVVKESIMPAYPWLFEVKSSIEKGDVAVAVPDSFIEGGTGKVVATREALQLVAYLQSLKQTELPGDRPAPAFLYPVTKKETADGVGAAKQDNGAELYAANCQVCHQANGEGLKGAFPPLKGSPIVLNDDASQQIDIIMNGYTGRASEGYGPMPNIGTTHNFTAADVAAIVNHERSSWGNNSKKVDVAAVEKFLASLKAGSAAKK